MKVAMDGAASTFAIGRNFHFEVGPTTADAVPACVPTTSNDAGPVAACPCLRTQACPAGGPSALACNDEGLDCNYSSSGNACGIVNCICRADDGGLHWECYILLP